MTIGFISNPDFFMRFFEKCMELGLDTEEERLKLLAKMAVENEHECSVFETQRTKEEVIEDAAKNYGKVLHIKTEEE